MLGITESYTIFDTDIIIHINSVFATLTQLGVGPKEGFMIKDYNLTWNDFISKGSKLEFVKSYMYLKVRMLFDPPLTSSVLESMNRMASEYEWRLQVATELVDDHDDSGIDESNIATEKEVNEMLDDVFSD